MQVQKINNQASFGANVHIDSSLSDLGKDAIRFVSQAFPKLLDLGDNKTDIFIKSNFQLNAKPTELIIASKKTEQVICKSFVLSGLRVDDVNVSAEEIVTPISAKSIVAAAEKTVSEVNDKFYKIKTAAETSLLNK